MFYITGDTHGNFSRYNDFVSSVHPSADDTMIVLGDAGLNYFADARDTQRKAFVNSFPFKTFCIQGNHELRPEHVPSYELHTFRGGKVWVEPDFPNLLFAKDGEIFDFDSRSVIVIGGAYSVDKFTRLMYGYRWFADEQPSNRIKIFTEAQLASRDWQIDVVLSHTCPWKYEPVETFLSGFNQDAIDDSTEHWLDSLESRLLYNKWYCGHFHTSKTIDKIVFVSDNIIEF